MAASTSSGITLTDEICPPSTEMDDVYRQLEALSHEVQSLQQEDAPRTPEQSCPPHKTARTIQAGIDQLRVDVHRIRYRTPTPTADHSIQEAAEGATADHASLYNDLVQLRTEIDELLIEQIQSGQTERLPSYHSRKALAFDTEPLPPVPDLMQKSG